MSESKRIEGQMFLRGGVGWAVAVVLLLLAAGGTLLIGYLINRWTGFVGTTGVGIIAGGAGARSTGAWAGPMTGLPGAVMVTVDSVPWPVAAGAPFREHWEKKVPGIGTLNQWYMDPNSQQGWQWGSSISIPVEGESRFVIVVHVPRGSEPPDATGGQLWVCELASNGVGDIMPSEQTIRVRATLTAEQVRYLWESDFPPGLAQDLVDAAHGRGPLAGAGVQRSGAAPVPIAGTFTPIDTYFKQRDPPPGEDE